MHAAGKVALAVVLAGGALAGCRDEGGAGPKTSRPLTPAARVVGPAQSCVPISQLRETRIRDDSTIDFIGTGKAVWRVTLPNACPQLKSENRFSYETSLTQLCSNDIIYVLMNYGGTLQRGAGCGLGPFVPVELADTKEAR